MPYIQTILDLSTAHMSQSAFAELDQPESPAVYRNEYGLIVPTLPNEMVQEWIDALSAETLEQLLRIIGYARRLGCDYVKFDADAEIDERLPAYDWP